MLRLISEDLPINYSSPPSYPKRYTLEFLQEVKQKIKDDIDIQDDYDKWTEGINWKTGRRLKTTARLYKSLEDRFIFTGIGESIHYKNAIALDVNDYNAETIRLNKVVDDENALIDNYQRRIRCLMYNIRKSAKEEGFIELDGLKYGVTIKVAQSKGGMIHEENECLGKMILVGEETTSVGGNCRPFCITEEFCTTDYLYECSKCGYLYTTRTSVTYSGSNARQSNSFDWM